MNKNGKIDWRLYKQIGKLRKQIKHPVLKDYPDKAAGYKVTVEKIGG